MRDNIFGCICPSVCANCVVKSDKYQCIGPQQDPIVSQTICIISVFRKECLHPFETNHSTVHV